VSCVCLDGELDLMVWKHRYSILSIIFCAEFLCYLDRMVMASTIPFIAADFGLSPMVMGEVLSAFFVGYAFMQIPGGLLADRFGTRRVLTTCITWWSAMTALTGMVPGLTAMLVVRVLFGVGEGSFPPASAKALSIWFPRREVGRANGVQLASSMIGATVAPLFVVTMIVGWGWRSVFYALSVPGALLAAVVWRYIRNSPSESRHVSRQEMMDYDVVTVEQTPVKSSLSESIRTPAILWCAACLFFINMAGWGLMNWLPTYLLQARGFSIERMGVFTALTNFAGVLGSLLGGILCDKYFGQKLHIPMLFGLIVSGIFTYFAAVAPTGDWAVASLLLVFLCTNMACTAIFTLPLVIVPKHAVGAAFGIVNTAGQLAGVFSPLLVGYVLHVTHGSFAVVLYVLVGLTFVAVYPAIRIGQSPRSHA
jgi:sugar phosphate permease